MSLLRYALRRLGLLVPTLLGAYTLIFFIMNILPGDVSLFFFVDGMPEYVKEDLKRMYGMDVPAGERYLKSLFGLLSGNLGHSPVHDRPVFQVIVQALPLSLLINFSTMVLIIAIALPLGIIGALRRGSKTDLTVSGTAFALTSIPNFWLGLIFLLIFGVWFHWIAPATVATRAYDLLASGPLILLAALSIALGNASFLVRIVRSSVLEVLLKDYIVTARAKGLNERVVIYKHALKNAMIPVVTTFGRMIGGLVGGQFIAEFIFLIPGIGMIGLNSIYQRDITLVTGIAVITILAVVIGNFVADMMYAYIDPRIRLR